MKTVTSQEISSKYGQGRLVCPTCGRPFPMPEGATPLSSARCPSCGGPVFVPMRLGKYLLCGVLGEGGMGTVYEAVEPAAPTQRLAVKLLSREAREKPDNILALLNESRIAALFTDSDFTVGCVDSGLTDGEYFSVSPFIEGERLDNRVTRLGRLSEADTQKIALHLLAAEQHIFRKGYLFRDMKPENVIINRYGYAVLIDFGLCKSLSDAAGGGDNYIAGSPYYIPPERLLGEGEDASSEIYSIGMVMYYAITGQNYFNADEIDALAKRHVSGLRLSNTGKMDGFTPSLAELMDLMIRQHKKERPQDFLSVAKRLEEIGPELKK